MSHEPGAAAAYDIVPAAQVDPDALAQAIGASFGKPRSEEWFRWKHLEAPWGPSTGWVALDDEGVLGLRLFTPWQLEVDGEPLTMQRAMDGAVVPRARRRGIFQSLVSKQMDLTDGVGDQLLFSTAVPASQAAYQKLGWTVLPRVVHRWTPMLPLPTRSFAEVSPGDCEPTSVWKTGAFTAWDRTALAWRTDPRSGRHYRAATLDDGDEPNGLIWREQSNGPMRFVVELLAWGSASDRRRLRRGAAWATKAPICLHVVDEGRSVGIDRGGSTVAIWTRAGDDAHSPWGPAGRGIGWHFTLADVEGVM